MDESKQLINADEVGVNWRTKANSNKTARLGDTVRQVMEDWISPQQSRFGAVAQHWSQLLPVELCRHCRLGGMSGGQLKVLVDSPSYMHELRLCSPQLLKELQQRCPAARIKRIKFAIG
ncbi:MAG: DciA family protein [Planctomycetota bacterium]|jgi:predicted nucleic acid-binding Zn ribbon protein